MTSPDAMSVTFAADEDAWEWDETWWCTGCQQDRLLGMELREGRVMGTCEWCQQQEDYTPPDDDEPVEARGWSAPQTVPYYRVVRTCRLGRVVAATPTRACPIGAGSLHAPAQE
jgi:hypothetical protein